MIPLAAESIRLGTEGHGSHHRKCCLNTCQPETAWSCLVAVAALHHLILSRLPLIQLTARIKLERIFFSEVMPFFSIQTQLCAWVLATLQSKTEKVIRLFSCSMLFSWLCQLKDLRFFCSAFGWLSFFFLFFPLLPHPRLSRALVLTVRALREQRRKMCSQS